MRSHNLIITITLLLFANTINSEESNLREARDSYLDAYTESHGGSVNLQQVQSDTSREYTEAYPYPAANPNFQYGPPVSGPSAPAGPPPIKYGYSAPSAPAAYPHHHYPPPVPVYGPPPYHPPYNEMPHGMLGILDKIKMKIDLFTIGKILLKLVIFKKIVSLIAILCLLLFIPSLKHKTAEIDNNNNGDDDEEDRGFNTSKNTSGVDNAVTSFVIEAIENFAKNLTISEDQKCKDAVCLKSQLQQQKSAKQQ